MDDVIALTVVITIIGGIILILYTGLMIVLALMALVTLWLLPGIIMGIYDGAREWRREVLEERRAEDSNLSRESDRQA